METTCLVDWSWYSFWWGMLATGIIAIFIWIAKMMLDEYVEDKVALQLKKRVGK